MCRGCVQVVMRPLSVRGGRLSVVYSLGVNLDVPALHDDLGLGVVGRVLQPVAQEEHDGDALPELVRTSGRTRSELSRQFVKHPVLGRGDTLEMLLGTTSHLGPAKSKPPSAHSRHPIHLPPPMHDCLL